MDMKPKKHVCSRGHVYYGRGPCPICWPGGLKKAVEKAFTKRHADGTLWAKGFIQGGKMTGFWKWFRKDGTVMRTGSFVNGKQAGKWTTYDKKGKVVKVTKFGKRP